MTFPDDEQMISGIRRVLDGAVASLSAAGARDEALAEYVPERRVFGVPRKPVLRPLGRVWRLGVFLLGADGTLYETGLTTRALEAGRPAYQSASAEQRRAYRAAATRGRFPHGETVNFDAVRVELDSIRMAGGRLFVDGDQARVRWNPTAEPVDFASYLTDRVELLAEPPAGA
ncbi:hypothetical protein IWX78_000485 [Mycetocola sp. CAN_C7]|uniref:hypothetical protein n=1 Tax=Mycetocola sp. CAN_C7 TaxID=2787724 RepID=UPI0018CA0D7A